MIYFLPFATGFFFFANRSLYLQTHQLARTNPRDVKFHTGNPPEDRPPAYQMRTNKKGLLMNITKSPLKSGAQEQNRTADTGIFSS
jgi:hypothetical protein